MDKPQYAASGRDHNQEDDRLRHSACGKICKCRTQRHTHISLNELESEQTNRGRYEQLPRPALYKLFVCVSLKKKPGTDSGNHKENRHEPRIHEVHEDVIRLACEVRDLSESAQYSLRVIHIQNVIEDYDYNCDPSDVV